MTRRDPREGMRCCLCNEPLLRAEWPQHPGDAGMCDRCSRGSQTVPAKAETERAA